MKKVNEDAPANNIGSGNISNPHNRLLGNNDKMLYRKSNRVNQELLKRWLKGTN